MTSVVDDGYFHLGPDLALAPQVQKETFATVESLQAGGYAPSDLHGLGFVASVVLAAMACIFYSVDSWVGGRSPGAAAVVVAMAVVVASLHAWRARNGRLTLPRLPIAVVWRHRVILLVLGASCAWLTLTLLQSDPERVQVAGAFVIALAGAGGVGAASDRPSLVLWLVSVTGAPVIALLAGTVGGAEVEGTALLLGAAGLVILWFAQRVHGLVELALAAQCMNAQLVGQLRDHNAMVEAARREKTRFLGAASHDLRQPMHALGLFAAALETELRGTAYHAKIISMARAVDTLEESFGAMLDVSRLDAGVIEPNPQTFPIRDVFRRLHMLCAGQAELKGLSLRLKPGGKLVTSDPQLLERILGNLVHNAIRYTHEGGVVVVVRSHAGRTSIETWDTGVGISVEQLPMIFNEFYQTDNAGRDRSRGLGMGLAIVKRLVLLLGYELQVRSRPGRGTLFRLLLPATELAELPSMVLGADTIPSLPEDDRTVLVIDDDEAVRAGMKELLESWGCTVLIASGVIEAQAAVRSCGGVIDVVVSDLRLAEDEDGLQAIAQVRAAYGAPLPAILITGDTSPAEVRRAHEGGFPVLFKPVRSRDLFAALRRLP